MDSNAIIGHIEWDACDGCKHSDHSDEGCSQAANHHGFWPATVDGDDVYCDLYEPGAAASCGEEEPTEEGEK